MKYLISMIALLFGGMASAAERESYYSDIICETELRGTDNTLPSGLRPDCETSFAIIEFDWAKSPKHYECIGQAFIYAQQTGKLPVCILMARDDDELEFGRSLDFSDFGLILRIIDVRAY
jgi:hypothetical protein